MNNNRQSGISPKKNQKVVDPINSKATNHRSAQSANQKSAQPTFNNVLSKPTKGITALYERLSREDGEDGISNSITNQKALLEDYAKKHGFKNIRHFSDDGWSGTNFDRPAWKELIAEVKAGNVENLILKDMTRFGRDHVQVGIFMETFRSHGVRFIAIGNSIDSIQPDTLEFAPFINIMSEWVARDTSRKIKAAITTKGNSGKRTTNHAIYGFMKDPNDKYKWIIDEEAAAVVRRIFQMVVEGMGTHQIARQLNSEQVYCPAYYLAQRGQGTMKTKVVENPYMWHGTTVGEFIAKPEYMGDTVNFRWYKDSYKDRRAKKTPDDELVIFENTHPAIVDRETWHTAQRCRKTVRRTDGLGEANPLTGLLLCAQCGSRMYNRRRPYTKERIAPSGNVYTQGPEDFYNCAAHKMAFQNYNKSPCTPHHTPTAHIREIVLGVITRVSGFIRENESSFIQQVREDSSIKHEATLKSHRKQLAKSEKRHAELDGIIRGLYEDKHKGVLTEKRFEMLATGYENEQEKLEQQIQNLLAEIETFNADSDKADKFISIVKKYTDFTELTAPMLREFVEKILVHEADKSSGVRIQKIEVCLNFIGTFDVPPPDPTPEEIAEMEERIRKREKRREYDFRWKAKKKRLAEEAAAQTATPQPPTHKKTKSNIAI